MLTPILIGLAVLLIVFVIVVATRSAEFRITRTTTIAAPPLAVFAQVNDFHRWMAWSPWEKLDPALKRTYAGPAAGTRRRFRQDGLAGQPGSWPRHRRALLLAGIRLAE